MAETTISANMAQLKEVTAKIKNETDPIKRKELFQIAINLLTEEYLPILTEEYLPIAVEAVKEFEGKNSIKTTQGNYGKYMSYMSFLSDPNLKGAYFSAMVNALRKAGAGGGLEEAIRIIKGY